MCFCFMPNIQLYFFSWALDLFLELRGLLSYQLRQFYAVAKETAESADCYQPKIDSTLHSHAN